MTDNKENSDSKTPSSDNLADRRFRRYHRVQARRQKAAQEDARFTRALFSIAAIAAAIAIGLGVVGMNGLSVDQESAVYLTDPWLGPFSRMEVFGLGFIALIAILFLWRIRKR